MKINNTLTATILGICIITSILIASGYYLLKSNLTSTHATAHDNTTHDQLPDSIPDFFNSYNKIIWTSEPFEVANNSVVPIPERCPNKAILSLDNKRISQQINTDIEPVSLSIIFSYSKSYENKYWIIKSDIECLGDTNSCITKQVFTHNPKTTATVSCQQYEGLTIELGEDGKPIFKSDIPIQQEAIKKINERKKIK